MQTLVLLINRLPILVLLIPHLLNIARDLQFLRKRDRYVGTVWPTSMGHTACTSPIASSQLNVHPQILILKKLHRKPPKIDVMNFRIRMKTCKKITMWTLMRT
jgi:hypothetical protein